MNNIKELKKEVDKIIKDNKELFTKVCFLETKNEFELFMHKNKKKYSKKQEDLLEDYFNKKLNEELKCL